MTLSEHASGLMVSALFQSVVRYSRETKSYC
jgi:hypothetical protein